MFVDLLNIWHPPIFPIDHWNVNQHVLDKEAKTTNSLEGWHRAFSAGLIGHQPFWDFLNLLQNEEGISWQKIIQFRAGRPHRPKKEYENLANQLRNVVLQFAQNEPLDHLRNIARLIGNGTQFVNLNGN